MVALDLISQNSSTDAIARQRKLAELLQAQAMQQSDPAAAAPGGLVIPQGPLHGLSKLAEALSGAYIGKKADESEDAKKISNNQALARILQAGSEKPLPAGFVGPPDASQQAGGGMNGMLAQALQESQNNPDMGGVESAMLEAKLKSALGTESPSAVREYEYYNKLNTSDQEKYLNVKRAQQTLNLGGTQAVLNPTGGVAESYPVTPKPDQMPDFQRQVAQAKKQGEQTVENQQAANSTQDIVGLYNTLKNDAADAPSGGLESGVARASNFLNMPTKGAVAQGRFDADLNNLYLATIRSLKGTGRVMEQELNKISEAAPKPSDSMEVKIAKADAHMAYYTNRMKELGVDPSQPSPGDTNPGAASSGSSLPAGSKLIGTSGGKAVYQLPDGSHMMEQ